MTRQSIVNFFNKSGGNLQERERWLITCGSNLWQNVKEPINLTLLDDRKFQNIICMVEEEKFLYINSSTGMREFLVSWHCSSSDFSFRVSPFFSVLPLGHLSLIMLIFFIYFLSSLSYLSLWLMDAISFVTVIFSCFITCERRDHTKESDNAL